MKQFLTIIIFFTTVISFAQSFEGVLTYKVDIEISEKMAKMGITKERIADKMKKDGSWADSISVSYKRGNYYTLNYATPKTCLIYTADTNKTYGMQIGGDSDICMVIDDSIDMESTMTGKMPVIEKLTTTELIDGVNCNRVSVTWKSGTYTYYYDPNKLKTDPALFSKHIYDGWSGFLQISKALPVKIVKTTNGFMTLTMTLTSYKERPVDDKLFVIPELVADGDLNMVKVANRQIMRIKK